MEDEADRGASSGKSADEEGIAEPDDDTDDSDSSHPPSPRVRDADEDHEEEERPRFGGLGLGASKAQPSNTFSGFTKSGIGSARPAAISQAASPAPSPSPTPTPPSDFPVNLPSAFGAARAQRSFVRNDAGPSRPAVPLPPSERIHFSKLQGSFGARMLEKMGWQAGTGLGATGEGIVTPVESKLRPKKMGIAFRGFVEKTEQSKAEARRRGEIVSDDEEDAKKKSAGKGKGKPGQETKKSDVWKRPKKVKTKVEHKTYEQIVAEAGQENVAPTGIGIIIDATGATPREISSLAEVSTASWTPSTDPTRIPEVRHNLRLITDAATSDLEGLAREAKEIQRRRNAIRDENARLAKRVNDEAELIHRMQQVHLVIDEIHTLAKELASVYEASLDPFSPHVEKLFAQFPREYDRFKLDEIVVAAITPIVRRTLAQWKPLEEPDTLLGTFRTWRRALKLADHQARPPEHQVGFIGAPTLTAPVPQVDVPMTPFESLLWNIWLPRVRSSINNDWDPRTPNPAVRLYEAWSTFLPPFIRDNFLDQLILPKVSKAISDWSPRRDSVSLRTLVFPWLPHLGLRLEDFLEDARRKVKSVLRSWTAADSIPDDLTTWREVFKPGDWDAMTLKYIVPKLGSILRDEFRVNPRQQDMVPLNRVLAWANLVRGTVFGQLLQAEFFPKWLDVLHVWLVQPRPSFEEVAQWYAFWKSVFPEAVQDLSAVRDGFTRGLQLMNKAIELGPDAPSKLPRPDHHKPGSAPPLAATTKAKKPPARMQEYTFRSIVEERAAEHNLMFIPTQRAHEKSQMPLFRVSPTADGKGGILVYILDDAVWAPDSEGTYAAISLDTMVLRASKGG
ncbi:GC-rich sequence DNA-binding factor-like protein-domain-containing protein [Amylostereum chailletii]|nr:GC-rich sequence DNA-binding factor-like protein-domain-containing protein [Amylostereum chailletii]